MKYRPYYNERSEGKSNPYDDHIKSYGSTL